MKTKFLAQLLLSTCLISSCTSEDIEFSDVNEQGSIETTTLDIDEAKSLLQEFVADAFTKSNTSFTIKEHKLKTLYIDNTETLPVTVRDTIPVYEFTTETDGQEGYSVVVGDKRVEKVLISVPSGLLSDTSFIEPLRLYYRDIPMLIQQDLNQYYAETQEKAIQTKMSVEACYKDLPTLWSQGYPYNEKCPIKCYDHALAGCNAIAIAQILAYHRVPTNLNWITQMTKSPLAAQRTAAEKLYLPVKPYIGAARLANLQETAAIEGLLVDLDKDGMPEALAALTLTEVVASLKEKNQQYAALTEQRTNAQADNPVESAKKIRLRMDEEYDEMTTYAFAQSVVKPTATTATFINRLNTLIDETNALYNQRIAQAKAAAKKQADSESPSEI